MKIQKRKFLEDNTSLLLERDNKGCHSITSKGFLFSNFLFIS